MRAASDVFRVVVVYGHGGLHDDWPGVELWRHEVHGGARHLRAVREGLARRVRAGERRQQRRVDVENRVGKRVAECGPQASHESGQTDEPDVTGAQFGHEGTIVVVAGRVVGVRHHARADAGGAGHLEPRRVRTVRDHDIDRDSRLDDRPQIRSAP